MTESGSLLRRVEPWLWIPLVLVLSLEYHVFESTPPVAPLVLLPLSAFLGRKYGRRALVVIAFGGLPLALGANLAWVHCAPRVDVVLASLLLASLSADPRGWLEAGAAWGRSVNLPALLLLGPLSLGLASWTWGELGLSLAISLECLLYLGLFLVGLARRPAARILPGLAAVALAGGLLEAARLPHDARDLVGGPRAELPGLGLTDLSSLWLHHDLDSPSSFLAAVACFLGGGFVARLMTGERPLRSSWRLGAGIAALALVTLAGGVERGALEGMDRPHLPPIGSVYALPVAALLAGMVYGRRGLLALLLLTLVAWAIEARVKADGDAEELEIPVRLFQPIHVASFGVMGLVLRDAVLGTATRWWSLRWTWRTLLIGLFVILAFEPNAGLEVLLAVAMAILAAAGVAVLSSLRSRFLGPTASTHRGWWTLCVLLLVVGMARTMPGSTAKPPGFRSEDAEPPTSLGQELGQMLVQLQDQASEGSCPLGVVLDDHHWLAAAIALLLGWAALRALGQLLEALPLMATEVQHLFGAVRGVLAGQWPAALTTPSRAHPSSVLRNVARLAVPIRWTCRALMVLGLALGVALGGYAAHVSWQEGREEAWDDDEEWRWPTGVVEEETIDEEEEEPPPTPPPSVNPHLWRAALEAFAEWPIEEQDAERGWLATGWRTEPSSSDERSRVRCEVGEALASHGLDVHLLSERRWHMGLWVERDSYYSQRDLAMVGESSYLEQSGLRDRIVARALELEAATSARSRAR